MSIGLTPNKSKTLGSLEIPDKYFFDFLRGEWDGDGTAYSFWDNRWRSSYMFYLGFASGSLEFLVWLNKNIQRLSDIKGKITPASRSYQLRYAKKSGKELFKKMFYKDSVSIPHLPRKFAKAHKIFKIDENNAKKWRYR